MPQHFWKALERLPDLAAVPGVWRRYLGEAFNAFQTLCLQPSPDLLTRVPCQKECGCDHFIILRHDRTGAIAVCCCNPPECPDIPLTMEEITPLQLDWSRLAYALAKALACKPLQANVGPFRTLQIGSWPSAAVPVILTIQLEPRDLHFTAAHLAATLKEKFILLTPTTDLISAETRQVLATVGAPIFDLASTVALNPDGTLAAIRPPEELFARFSPHTCRPSTLNSQPSTKYALRKHLGVWHLIFGGQEALIGHERGLFYVAWLLYHPDETPIHAIDLMAKVPEIYRRQLGLPAIVDPATGKSAVLESHARLQERSLALDDRESMRRLYKKQGELEALIDCDDATEPEKAEALRELEEIVEFQRHQARGSGDSARRAAHAAQCAVARFHRHIASAVGKDGAPHAVLQSFAEHVRQHILIPSARYTGNGGRHARAGVAGCFTYERPKGMSWAG